MSFLRAICLVCLLCAMRAAASASPPQTPTQSPTPATGPAVETKPQPAETKLSIADQASAALAQGRTLESQGNYAEAVIALRQADRLRPQDAEILTYLGRALFQSEHYAEAEPVFRSALGIRELALGPDHEAVAVSLNNLALTMKLRGDYASAEPLFRRALAIHEKALGPNHFGHRYGFE